MKKKTVTIINDHQLLSDLLANPLQTLGFEPPHTFTNLEDGIEYISKHTIDFETGTGGCKTRDIPTSPKVIGRI